MVHVAIRSPEVAPRPVDVVCVVDTSVSMDLPAAVKTKYGDLAGYGISRLDVVKHAISAMVRTLTPNDRVAIVSYNDVASVNLKLTTITPVCMHA